MAGGVGSRFWPMSQESYPKQFLDVLGTGKTLIQMTTERLKRIAPENQIYVLTNAKYADLVEQQTGLPQSQILKEPMMKNTAPCIAYAAHKILGINPDANLVVAPSDHLILKEDEFVSIIQTAISSANADNGIVTLGIKPSRPDTGYGYIQKETGTSELGKVYRVERFREKPDLETAKEFVADGNFYWNSGIFIWKCQTIVDALKKYQPDLNNQFSSDLYNTPQEQEFVNGAFAACESISVDYAILENATNVSVVLADFGWSDLGTWGSLYTHLSHDAEGNAVVGGQIKMVDSSGNIVNLPKDKKALIQGLDGYIVVEAHGILMIIKKENEQLIKEYSKMIN